QDTGELPALTGSAAGLLEQDTGELPALTGSAAGPLEQDTGELPTLTGTPLTGTTSEPSVGPRIPRQAGPQDRSPLFEPLEPVPLPEPPRRRPRSTPEDSATTTDLDTPGSPPLTGRPTDPFGTLTAPQTVAPAAPDTDAGPSQPDGE